MYMLQCRSKIGVRVRTPVYLQAYQLISVRALTQSTIKLLDKQMLWLATNIDIILHYVYHLQKLPQKCR